MGGDSPRLLQHEVTIVDSGTFLKSKSKSKVMHKIGEILCPEFHFDIASVHAQNEVTDNRKSLTNQKPKGTGRGYTNGLQYYRGVLGTRPFSKLGQYYFEVSINFFVKRSLRQDLIFEVALCRREM
ncbi:hypothetical protein ScPMuIL_017501 [Solemya velum]